MIPRTARWILLLFAVLADTSTADPRVDAVRWSVNGQLRAQRQQRALTVRDRRVATEPARSAELLLFCRQKGVGALFVEVSDPPFSAQVTPDLEFGWRQLVSGAHRQGMAVYAACGNTAWIHDHGRALEALDRIAGFCRRGQPAERFDGVLLQFDLLAEMQRLFPAPDELEPAMMQDLLNGAAVRRDGATTPLGGQPGEQPGAVPPDDLPEIPGTDQLFPVAPPYDRQLSATTDLKNHELLRQYLTVLRGLRAYLVGARHADLRLRVGVVFPAWLRLPLGFRGEIKFAHEHFVDVADFCVVHNLPGESTEIGRAADGVLRYAGATAKDVYLRVEMFYPQTAVPTLISLFGRDELFLEETLGGMLAEQGSAPSFRGFVIDDYLGYRYLPTLRLEPFQPGALLPVSRPPG